MKKPDIAAIKKRCEAATGGEWFWDVHKSSKYVCLESTGSRYIVMDFVRYGMSGAAPRFRDNDCIMRRADELAKSYSGKEHHIGFDDYINHPDAEFIAHSKEDVENLLTYIEQLEAERDAAIAHITPKCEICAKDNTNMCPGRKCFFQGYEYFEWRGTEGK